MMTAKTVLAAVVLLFAGVSHIVCAAEPRATVRLVSGREFSGLIDATSTEQQLVLRSAGAGITIKRPVRWERIVVLEVDGNQRDVAAVRAEFSGHQAQKRERTPPHKVDLQAWPRAPAAMTVVEEELPPPRVATVAFDPQIANWDGDVETDGVVIFVTPLDAYGNLLPLGGTLEVELYAPQRRTLDQAPQSGGDTLELVERWTRAITPEDFGARGARVQLPFGAITPELQPNWTASHYGLVYARLSIPGQGVYGSTRDGVRVRPWAPNRDRLEMKTGQRFLSNENLGRRE
jgi:hypothetical protein